MKMRIVMLILFCVLLTAGCGAPKDDARLKASVTIDGQNVSGMTIRDARTMLAHRAKTALAQRTILFEVAGRQERVPLAELGVSLDTESALQAAARLRNRGGKRDLISLAVIDEEACKARLDALVSAYESEPQNAAVSVDPSFAAPISYRSEREGLDIDQPLLLERTLAALQSGASATVVVPAERLAASVTVDSILQKQALRARFETSFARAPHNAKNRVFNIKKAAEAINGMVLQPDEEFDCNAALGDRNEENGWEMAPGIRNGKYESEYGGGVCQVSSTLFNAVLMADLVVIERHPHSWPMGYVEIGRDATISTGGKNFRFRNSTSSPLYLFMHVDEEKCVVTASLYGEPLPNETYIDIVSETTGTIESAGETRMLDESLPFQTRMVEREPRDGKTSVTYKEYRSKDGTLMRREVACEDTYRAIDGLTYLSTDLYYS